MFTFEICYGLDWKVEGLQLFAKLHMFGIYMKIKILNYNFVVKAVLSKQSRDATLLYTPLFGTRSSQIGKVQKKVFEWFESLVEFICFP